MTPSNAQVWFVTFQRTTNTEIHYFFPNFKIIEYESDIEKYWFEICMKQISDEEGIWEVLL